MTTLEVYRNDLFDKNGVPNAVFPCEPEYDIPWLRQDLEGDFVDLPMNTWGAKARTSAHPGTINFYTVDAKFSTVWKNPYQIVDSDCTTICETNYTVSLYTPKAVLLEKIYRKRWLSRFFQEYGIRVFVDMLMPTEFAKFALLGVPKGWRAYSTRGYDKRLESLELTVDVCKSHRGGDDILMLVYGGGKLVRSYCAQNGLIYIPEDADVKRGKHLEFFNIKQCLSQRTRNDSQVKAEEQQSVGIRAF